MVNNTSDRSGEKDRGLEGRLLDDRFRVVEIVSAGANTIICNAFDEATNLAVTIKIVRPALAASKPFRREFERRADIAMALTHPNIAQVLSWGEFEINDVSALYWAVEHLGGGSLRDLLDRGRLLEPSQALVVGLEACRALDAAHQRGLVHTELTPSKLVFGIDKRLRLIDFSMAELMGRAAWAEPATVATHVARYASPEQALGLPVDAKTDVYALALSLLEAVSGSVPFSGDSTVSTLSARLDKLLPVSADLGSLASVLERAARPDAEDRFSAAEFGRALVQAAETLPRPEPIPVMASAQFDTSTMRRPSDPTGGVERPPDSDDVALSAATPVSEAAGIVVADTVGANSAVPDVTPADPLTAELPATQTVLTTDPLTAELPVTEAVPATDAPVEVSDPPTNSPADLNDDVAAAPGEAATASVPVVDDSSDDGIIILTDVADDAAIDSDGLGAGGFAQAAAVTAAAAAPSPTIEQPAVELTNQMPVLPTATPGTPQPTPNVVYDDERPKRRLGPIIVLTLFTLVGLAAVAFAASLLLETKSYEVPDLTGVQEAVARNEIAGNDWVIVVERERSDEQPDENAVIRTFPTAGAVLDEGAEFTMFVSQGPMFRVLPELTGQSTPDAQAQLEALQLTGFVEGDAFDETAAIGDVLSWRVQGDASRVAGDEVLPGTSVAFTVSKGPEPRSVPNVLGLTLEAAKSVVGEVRLNVTVSEEVFSDDVPVGQIVSQDTEVGTQLARDSTFTVTISKGLDLIELPELDGLSFVEAQQTLTEAGFTIGSLLGTTDGVFESISVDAEPIDGLYRRGTEVDLIFLGQDVVEAEPDAAAAPAEDAAPADPNA